MGASALGAILAVLFTVPAGLSAAELGQPAPDFSLPSIHAYADGADGMPDLAADAPLIRLADYRGRIVYVDFWSAWCAPCRESLPDLAALYDEQAGGQFEILSVNVDPLAEDGRRVLASIPVRFPVASDVLQTTTEHFGVAVLPAGALIDADGRVVAVWQGEVAADHGRLRHELNSLISGGAGVE